MLGSSGIEIQARYAHSEGCAAFRPSSKAPGTFGFETMSTTPSPMNWTPTHTSRKPMIRTRAVMPVGPTTATMRRALRRTSQERNATRTMPPEGAR
jgi:hypothetical protein